jgi:hypothetical protein
MSPEIPSPALLHLFQTLHVILTLDLSFSFDGNIRCAGDRTLSVQSIGTPSARRRSSDFICPRRAAWTNSSSFSMFDSNLVLKILEAWHGIYFIHTRYCMQVHSRIPAHVYVLEARGSPVMCSAYRYSSRYLVKHLTRSSSASAPPRKLVPRISEYETDTTATGRYSMTRLKSQKIRTTASSEHRDICITPSSGYSYTKLQQSRNVMAC